MLAVIMIIIGIALMSALLYGGAAVLQSSSPARSQTKENTITAFYGLASAYQAYANANGSTGTNGSILTTGSCNGTQLVPTYLKEIKYPTPGLSCSYGIDGTSQCTGASCGNYFCYYGSMSQAAYNGFNDAAASFPASSYYISTSACGGRTTSAAPGAWPSTVYVTYWLLGQ